MNHYNPNKKNLLVSFSGGRTSAYLCHIAKKYFSKTHNLLFVFANTGKEKEETLEFVKQCDLHFNLNLYYIEAQFLEEFGKRNWFKIKDFDTLSRNGEPFEAFIKKEGVPNSKNSGCSTRLKSRPIHKFVKYYIGWKEYETAIGIRFDEKHRISWPKAKANDVVAQELFNDFGSKMVKFLKPWIQKFGIEVLVIGGNISRAFALFSDAMYDSLNNESIDLKIYISELKETASFIGSATLIDDTFYEEVLPSLSKM